MDYEKLKLGMSPITKTVFAGKLNKNGDMWLGKKDVTQDFLNVVAQYFSDKKETEITLDGEVVIIVKNLKGVK